LQGRLSKEDIDVRMCKALSDLPTDQGIEAVEKFASANLDAVRSKTGFMVRASANGVTDNQMGFM
jgi:Heterogeneous nuclear ribonucleoprotein Q acidic domain